MASSDIYELKEPPWAKKAEPPKKRRRKRRQETFDEVVKKDLSATHRRRSRNSGFRRLRHLLKNPKFSKKFWISILGSAGLVLIMLIVWDLFFRYPKQTVSPAQDVYQPVVK
ncbi:MAG: hypothetical protein WCH86_07840 [Kiritimatiellales bacterium]